jgi:hypothetical protein
MFKITTKIVSLSALLLLLALPSLAQNTKGDKPQSNRETRFKKSEKKTKISKSNRGKTSDLRAYKPRKKSKKGEHPGSPVGGHRRVHARPGTERSKNIYPQHGRFVNNSSASPREKPVISKRTASGGPIDITKNPRHEKNQNIYPQKGRFVNNSSKTPRREENRSVPNRKVLSRLSNLQGREPKPGRKPRVQVRSASRSYVARKTINIQARFPRPKHKAEKAYTKDIAGRRLRTKNYESQKPKIIKAQSAARFSRTGPNKIPHSDSGRYGRYKNYSSANRIEAPPRRRSVRPRSVSGNIQKRISRDQRNYISPRPKSVEHGVSNRSVLNHLRGLQSRQPKPGRKPRIVPRSASASFTARRSTNVWAHFPRPKHKSEQATTRDIAGKRLRTRNYESPRPGITAREFKPYSGRNRRIGDRPYRGPAGGFSTASKRGQKAWLGDIARRTIRGIKKPRRDTPTRIGPGGYKSATKPGEKRTGREPLPVKQPGMSAEILRHATGKVHGRRGIKGGGSVSGMWNNKGKSLAPKIPRNPDRSAGVFQGNIKRGRQPKGGGSISGRVWNNDNMAIATRIPPRKARKVNGYPGKMLRFENGQPGFRDQGEEFSGSIKAKRPAKGGGSVSAKTWNNKRTPLAVRLPADKRAAQMGAFQGNIKTKRPAKGGGSISGMWNNGNRAIANRIPPRRAREVNGYPGKMRRFETGQPGFRDQGEEYTGSIKASRPAKGGGSVSGKLWNNKKTPIPVRIPEGRSAARLGTFQGNIKRGRPVKGGGSVSGKLWNNKETPVEPREPGVGAKGIDHYTGNIKTGRPVKGGGSVSGKLWNNKETPIQVRIPNANGQKADGYSGTIKLSRFGRSYVRNPNASAVALKKTKPGKSVYQEGQLQTKVRQYDYVKNKSAADDAAKVREPGKSFARAADFQGNIKMQKFKLFERNKELHPDARFIRTNKNNVPEERDMLTNFKLWWARLFRKEETQPDHLKEKGKKPRYDKGEAGLWYE